MRTAILFLLIAQLTFAQFAPPVGQPGTTALYKDSSAFIAWADFCTVQKGLQDISNTSGPYASVGDSSKALGIADNSIVSLGDAGVAICTFALPIADGAGYDFAVFENSFNDTYLEFGFVEVSSDGVNFFRFPVTCNIQDTAQTGSFGASDATQVNNLAGKYRGLYGTPFDLAELQGISGLNVNNVTHVRIVDVVGSINPAYATHDQSGKKINDPWPTAFASSGFDLDAVGVIHNTTNAVNEFGEEKISVYPNPCKNSLTIDFGKLQTIRCEVRIFDLLGNRIKYAEMDLPKNKFDISDLNAGTYILEIVTSESNFIKKIMVSE